MKIKNLLEMADVARHLFKGNYPLFVYRNQSHQAEIPCFCFHEAEIYWLEPMLQYLRDNDYRTLSSREFFRILTGEEKVPDKKSVFLTFDDGVGSMWTILYPLLKKYGLTATVFLIPGRMKEGNASLPNLEDVWAGKVSFDQIAGRDQGPERFATWKEIRIMHESGLMDFESHTLDHSLVFTEPRIVDFVRPETLARFHSFEFPRIRTAQGDIFDVNRIGMPLYVTRPRMAGERRYIDHPGLRMACHQHVLQNGGEDFFKQPDWRRALHALIEKDYPAALRSPQYESEEELTKVIQFELQESRNQIENHLPGKKAEQLCYPWGVGSTIAESLSKNAGYKMSYYQHPDFVYKVRVGQDPYKVTRIGSDFFYLLPGRGRQTLLQVIGRKFFRRFQAGSPYLTH